MKIKTKVLINKPRTKDEWVGLILNQPVLKAAFSDDLKEMCPLCRLPMRDSSDDCPKPWYHTESRKPQELKDKDD